jgi:gliding motility-associated-like protein
MIKATTVLTTTVLKYPKFLHQTMTDSTIIEHSDLVSNPIYFDRYKLLKVLLQLPLWDGRYHGADLPSDDYWFIVNYDLDGKDKIFKSHFSLKRDHNKSTL